MLIFNYLRTGTSVLTFLVLDFISWCQHLPFQNPVVDKVSMREVCLVKGESRDGADV